MRYILPLDTGCSWSIAPWSFWAVLTLFWSDILAPWSFWAVLTLFWSDILAPWNFWAVLTLFWSDILAPWSFWAVLTLFWSDIHIILAGCALRQLAPLPLHLIHCAELVSRQERLRHRVILLVGLKLCVWLRTRWPCAYGTVWEKKSISPTWTGYLVFCVRPIWHYLVFNSGSPNQIMATLCTLACTVNWNGT